MVNPPSILKCFKGFNEKEMHNQKVINEFIKTEIPAIAKKRNIPLLDMNKVLGGTGGPDEEKWCSVRKDNDQPPDGFHFGYKMQGKAIADFLAEQLAKKDEKKEEPKTAAKKEDSSAAKKSSEKSVEKKDSSNKKTLKVTKK